MGNYYGKFFQDWEIAVAKTLVNEFQRKWRCLEREGFDDLLQECLTHWYFAKDSYDPKGKASKKTFMGRVIRNRLIDLVRERESSKRKVAYLAVSLDEPAGEDENSLGFNSKVEASVSTIAPFRPFWKNDLSIDLDRAFQKLTPSQKELCYLVGEKGLNVQEVSDCLRTPRSTIYDELKRIRTIFIKVGLKDYLQ